MEICKIHKIPIDQDGWICPVCNVDRCRECDYINCPVDGRKKDFECSFSCRFCDSRVGLDHLVKCGLCGKEGCSDCIQYSRQDKIPICPDCGSVCSLCGKMTSSQHLEKCDLCPMSVCSECGIKECYKCGKKACHQHSFQCIQCGKWTCKECMGGTVAETGEKICGECAYKCPSCKRTVSGEGKRICDTCAQQLCEHCARECVICGKNFCKTHVHRCNICNEYVCAENGDLCPACGGYSCNTHFFKCGMCGIGYCEKCRPHKEDNLCNLCDNIVPLKNKGKAREFLNDLMKTERKLAGMSNWEYSEGKEIYIFYGKTMLTNFIIVADKKTKKPLNIIKVGITEKIRKMFS